MSRNFHHVLPPVKTLESIISQYLKDDIPSFDIGGFVVGERQETAHLLGKSAGIISGAAFAKIVFDLCGLKQTWIKFDGDAISEEEATRKEPICKVTGPINKILVAERTALNIMSRASGIATGANKVVKLVRNKGWQGHVAGTRKTTPGFGLVEKYSLLVGGASTHRLTLTQMTMLKDNHVWSTGSIPQAVRKAKLAAGFSSKVEVECRSFKEAVEAIDNGADIIMLDNYTPEELILDARKLKAKYPYVLIEASGGITEATIGDYLDASVDVVSMGKLTQGYACLDFSLKVQRRSKL